MRGAADGRAPRVGKPCEGEPSPAEGDSHATLRSDMRRICVFAGSNPGRREEYAQAARALGRELAARGLGMVYGGASVGLMNIAADAALEAGGEVIGVLPRGLFKREVAHAGLSALHTVGSMHKRKALMADLSDGFIALPG